MKFQKLIGCSASAAALATALSGVAFAQDEAPEARTTVDAIIVTAQKREQNLQDVPVVVTAVNEQQLEDAGVKDIKDLTVLTPGLLVTSTSNETVTTARIRGVGTVGDNPGLESSVGVVIDGVYRPRNGVSFGDLGEVERIEVLKGPQGTLFGKNTSAGVINVITAEPRFVFGGEAELTAGNHGAVGGSASVTGPIAGEALAGRLFVAKRERDGFYDVAATAPRTETEDANQDYYTIRGQLLYLPNDDLSVRLIGDYTERDEDCCLGVQTVNGLTQPFINTLEGGDGVAVPAQPFERVVYANRSTAQQITDRGLSAEIEGDAGWLGGATVTSITAWRNWRTANGQDSDFTGADLLYRTPDIFGREFDQFSQELRIAGAAERLNWLVGGFYARETLDSREGLNVGTDLEAYLGGIFTGSPTGLAPLIGITAPALTPGQGSRDVYHQTSETFALFTNNSLEVTDALELTLGLRWTMEDKALDAMYANSVPGSACAAALANRTAIETALTGNPLASAFFPYLCTTAFDPGFDSFDTTQSISESEWSGTAKAAYRFTPDIMTYVSYARGYKAGGFNLDRSRFDYTVPNRDTSFAPETVDSYELGAKTTWLDRTLVLNASMFHQTYENFQLNTFTGISFIVASIPEVISRGVDADVMWFTPVDGFTLQGGVTYAETQYGDFAPSPGVSGRLPNARVSFAPLWSGSTSAAYERDLGESLRMRASLNARYTSSYNTGSDLAPSKVQEELVLLNGRIGLGDIDERWTVELWGQNLTDEDYYQVAFDATIQPQAINAFLGAPRTYGITLRSKF